MIKVLELPRDKDISELSRELWVRKIGHQIRQTADCHEVLLANPDHYPELLKLAHEWQQGTLAYTLVADEESSSPLEGAGTAMAQWPVTAFLLLASGLATALISFESQPEWLARLSIVPFAQVAQGLAYTPLLQALGNGDIWRLVTPAFLHFGLVHLIFNGLWVWEMGRMIERQQSSLHLGILFLVCGITANVAQYAVGDILFGGLSGVVYALLGYCWFWDRLSAKPLFYIRKPVFVILMIWLVFCLFGGASLLGLGEIANAAHVAGLISGSLWAWLTLVAFKTQGREL